MFLTTPSAPIKGCLRRYFVRSRPPLLWRRGVAAFIMRIIAGQFKSRRLKGTPPPGIRPTSDKLRETIFNVLGPRVEGATFLDGCAGMGAVGIEAISRGAAEVYFVDQSRKATRIIRENLEALEIKDGFKLLEMDLSKALDTISKQFDVAFIDPPYDREDLYVATLERFETRDLLSPEGVLIMEHSKRATLPESVGRLHKVRSLVQGDAALAFYRAK
jgi:16S rRNA (guanine966-N2)-methyltransferase